MLDGRLHGAHRRRGYRDGARLEDLQRCARLAESVGRSRMYLWLVAVRIQVSVVCTAAGETKRTNDLVL